MNDLDLARRDATRSSGGGIGFLLAYGTTLILAGVLAFFLPRDIAALVVLFQGGVALPVAFALERRLGFPPMAADNPLRTLSVQMAMVQVLALPAVIIVYQLDPTYVPAAFGAIGGGHFLPYAWLHRTRLYVVLGILVTFVPWLLMIVWGDAAFAYIPLVWGALYWCFALLLRRRFSDL
jgi:hypothetical protein